MKTYKNLYQEIYSKKNLVLAWRKARKRKTQRQDVLEFEKNVTSNLNQLQQELIEQIYFPKPLETFVVRDPKKRKISKADFRDRIIHHALCNVIEPIFDKTFIYDNCANRKGKGSLFALNQFDKYKRKVTSNLTSEAYCLKADIKHYFREIDRTTLLEMIKRKIGCNQTIWLIKIILEGNSERDNLIKGLPLGNLTSQFFAKVYLDKLDQFVKHNLKAKYYIRYVDDFVLLHSSKEQITKWKKEIGFFLKKELKLELHPDKSKIINLSHGVDFVGFRNFYHYRLLRKRNIRNIQGKIKNFKKGKIEGEKFKEIWQGWSAYSDWSDNHNLKKELVNQIKTFKYNNIL